MALLAVPCRSVPKNPYPSADALLHRTLQHVEDWEQSWGAFDRHPSLGVDPDRLDNAFDEYLERLEGNYPFHHPRYAGQISWPERLRTAVAPGALFCVDPVAGAPDRQIASISLRCVFCVRQVSRVEAVIIGSGVGAGKASVEAFSSRAYR